MTIVVPFDGSDLAEAALLRATEFGTVFEEPVLGITVIPKGNRAYAVEQDWLDPDEEYDLSSIVSALHRQVTELCPSADYRHEVVGRRVGAGSIAKRLRRVAGDEDASMVFIGSENAGQMVTSVSSVGGTVAARDSYDVVIVRNRRPSKIAKLRNASSHRRKSDFYVTE